MRVLQLGPYPPPHGGVQTNLVAIRQFLLSRQIPCAVINLTRFRKPDGDDIYYPKNVLGLLWLLLCLQYDIIHLHLGGNLTPRLLGLSLVCCLIPHSKAILTFHSGGYPSSNEGRAARPGTLRSFVFRRFDRIIGVNPEIVAMFRKLGVSENRLRLIYPHAAVTGAPSGSSALPPKLQIFFETHSPVLIAVGLLEPEYDLPLQIEVLGRVREKFRNAGLLIAGAGSLEQDLRKLIQTKPYADHVLLYGDLPHPATLQAIVQSDLMLRTTLYDGDSISVREALQLGTPVIATENRMRPAGVRLIPPRNLAALEQAIEEALAAGRTCPKSSEPDQRNIEAILELYQEMMASA